MTVRRFVLTLAAMFLALAGGVVLGARVLSDPMLTGLRDDKGYLQQRNDALLQDNDALTRKLSAADQFAAQMSARIVRDTLPGRSVVLIRTPDADEGDVAALADLVGRSGGSVTGTIGLTEEFVGANSAEKLRSVVNSPIVPAGTALDAALTDPSAQAGDLLGIAVLSAPDPAAAPVDARSRDTVLATLRDTGFVTYPDGLGAAQAAVIVTGGTLPADAGNQGSTVARFAAGLSRHGSATVLAGRDGAADDVSAVAVIRSEAELADTVTTVDDIEGAPGRVTAVLAIQAMLAGAPAQRYGIGPGTVGVTVGQE